MSSEQNLGAVILRARHPKTVCWNFSEIRYRSREAALFLNSPKDKLDKAYEFMKQFVIDGMNLLEKFMDWIGEKVRDVGRGR